jgi:hypothetical protein
MIKSYQEYYKKQKYDENVDHQNDELSRNDTNSYSSSDEDDSLSQSPSPKRPYDPIPMTGPLTTNPNNIQLSHNLANNNNNNTYPSISAASFNQVSNFQYPFNYTVSNTNQSSGLYSSYQTHMFNNFSHNNNNPYFGLNTNTSNNNLHINADVNRSSPETLSSSSNSLSSPPLSSDKESVQNYYPNSMSMPQNQSSIQSSAIIPPITPIVPIINSSSLLMRKSTSCSSDTESLNSSSTQQSCSKKRRPVPTENKDHAYWEKRKKNNESAKRSRDAKRTKEMSITFTCDYLQRENVSLKAELNLLRMENEKLRAMMYANGSVAVNNNNNNCN